MTDILKDMNFDKFIEINYTNTNTTF
jgi:hypothetical protein